MGQGRASFAPVPWPSCLLFDHFARQLVLPKASLIFFLCRVG